MKKVLPLLFALIGYSNIVHSQTIFPQWISNFVRQGQQCATLDIATDSSGNSYVLEFTYDTSFTMPTVYTTYLLKYDTYGQLQWNVTLPTQGYPTTSKLKLGSDGSLYVAKRDSMRLQLTRISPAGNIYWSRHFASSCDVINDMAADDSANVYLIGTSLNLDSALIVKVDTSGNQVWSQCYDFIPGPYHYDRGIAVVVDRVGHVYAAVASQDTSNANWYRISLVRYSCVGQVEWIQGYSSGQDGDVPTQLRLLNDTMLIVVGYQSPIQGQADILTQRYDTSGNLIWTRIFNADSVLGNPFNRPDFAKDVVVTDEGNIAIIGKCADSGMPLWMNVMYDQNGNLKWWRQNFGSSTEPRSVAEDRDGHLIFCGNPGNSSPTSWGIGITKYDTIGNLLRSTVYNTPTISHFYYAEMTIDSMGNIYCTGGDADNNLCMVVTLKFSNVVAVPEPTSSDFPCQVYPNPASNSVTFEFEYPDESRQIVLINQLGQEVLRTEARGTKQEVLVGALAPGVYYYQIISNSTSGTTGKLSVQ